MGGTCDGRGDSAESATSPGEDDEPSPESLGRYKVSRRLGRGGMGSVYEALDPQLNRRVAIKVPFFPGPPDRQQRARQRFLRESRAAAIIEHPNVCQVFDAGEDAGRPFVVMAFVPGESLADRLKRDPSRTPAKRNAHRSTAEARRRSFHGIIHRDIKPGNILLQSVSGQQAVNDKKIASFAAAAPAVRS